MASKNKFRMSDKAQSNLRSWITFFAALGFLYGFYKRGDEPGPYWTLLIGAMLGLAVLVSAMTNVLGGVRKDKDNNDSDQDSAPTPTRSRKDPDPDSLGDSGLRRVRGLGWIQ